MGTSTTESDLKWLVEARHDIQALLLALHNCRPGYDPSASDFDAGRLRKWALLVGAGFSLWRSVFLLVDADAAGKDSLSFGKNAEAFLVKVIKSNFITFGDDIGTHLWSGRYYLNNARFRLKRLLEEYGLPDYTAPGLYSHPNLRQEWALTLEAARSVLVKPARLFL